MLKVLASVAPAGITVVASAVHEAADTSTQTYNLPSGMRAGDVVVVAAFNAHSSIRYPTVSGYTEIAKKYGNDTYDASLWVGYKVMGSTPDTNVQVSGKQASTSASGCIIHVLRGVNTSTPLDVAATTHASDNVFPADPPAIEPVTTGAIIYVAGGGAIDASSNASYSAISDGFDGVIGNFSGSTVDGSLGAGVLEWTSGSVDPGQFTSNTSNLSASRAAVTCAFRPA